MDNFGPILVSQADQDFERFICSACHNLRESLREIRLRAESVSDGQIEQQIRAMESLLDGMMEYSLACASEGVPSRLEMATVWHQVLLQLDEPLQKSGAVVTQDPMPAVMGDSSQLARVLRHLLDNAIRFRGEAAPRIHLSARRAGNQWEFSVRDNGPGIEAGFQERVFLPFKRLHGRDYAGNGLGLAISKKLIERHHGKIWVESQPGCGATVLFTLPAAD
jgi:light-regulated signal transduction histidine kinase (bacteriophytochrome)